MMASVCWVIDAAAIRFRLLEVSNSMPKDGRMKGIKGVKFGLGLVPGGVLRPVIRSFLRLPQPTVHWISLCLNLLSRCMT